jgi:hypothetical protein
MASVVYPKCKEGLLKADIDLEGGTVKAALIDTGAYTYNAAHDFWDDASAGLIGTAQTLGTKTYTNGTFDAADSTFTSVTGNSVEAIIIYVDSGSAATSPLVAYIDSASAGLPVTPNGGNIVVTWNASGIFSL